ncbi:MAG: glycosyltransferase [Acidobacteriota bacterium]|nr:glycosyltransferase [Acidobacteriota bacterium]
MKGKVLHLIYGFLEGGTEHQMLQLTRLLQESGRYQVLIACLIRSGNLVENAERLVGPIPEFPIKSFYAPQTFVQLRAFASHLREHEIDVVHTHDFYSNIFGMAGAALARTPARIASRREIGGLRSLRQKFVERQAFRLAHSVVANSAAVQNRIVEEGVPALKVVTLYNGLDMNRVRTRAGFRRDQTLAAFGIPSTPRRRFVTIMANMRFPVKDHAMFLRTAQRVRAVVSDAAFIIAGEGTLLEQYRALAAQLGISDDVFFIGRCERVGELLGLSDVCVLSSRAEGFSNSILEYMAAARPVVVTDVGGAREAVVEGETGYIVPAGDDEKMAARIISLLNEPDRGRRMGELGRRVVEEKFSCAAQLARTEALYEELLADRVPLRSVISAQEEGT